MLFCGIATFAQPPHIYEHTYPSVTTENPTIRALMDSVSTDSIEATIAHLCSYYNRRCDSRHIFEVQDWLYDRYSSLGLDTVIKHDFKVNKPGFPEETGDNIIGIQWGVTRPEEYVVCGAHYDSWNGDGTDPDTIRSPGVLIARKNVFLTIDEHYEERWGESLLEKEAAEFANIIVWNIWQMDGLKCVVPLSCCEKEIVEEDLFERKIISKACDGCLTGDNTKHNGIYCVIMDWEKNKKVRFLDLVLGERGKAQK